MVTRGFHSDRAHSSLTATVLHFVSRALAPTLNYTLPLGRYTITADALLFQGLESSGEMLYRKMLPDNHLKSLKMNIFPVQLERSD